jgi:hypothetical protein
MVGGRLDIHGRAGGGTEVTLVVPVASADVDGHAAGATA